MRSLVLLCSLLSLPSCLDSDDLPTITEMTIQPATIPIGRNTRVVGVIHYDDEDGGELWAHVEITMPNGGSTRVPFLQSSQAAPINGKGSVGWWVDERPFKAGTYHVRAYVETEDGELSNRFDATFAAE